MILSEEEKSALEDVVTYLLHNEESNYDEWISMGNDGQHHIYSKAVILDGIVGRYK